MENSAPQWKAIVKKMSKVGIKVSLSSWRFRKPLEKELGYDAVKGYKKI